VAHDQRIGDEAWAWLSAVPDEDLDRDWQRVTESMAVTLDAAGWPASQRIGDLVVYCGAGTGVLAGVGEIVGRRQAAEDAPGRWRMSVLPRVVLDRTRAPSIAEVGMRPQNLHMGLDSDPYLRLRELVLSAAVPLVGRAPPELRACPRRVRAKNRATARGQTTMIGRVTSRGHGSPRCMRTISIATGRASWSA
jgi:hypothetical protein